jgi:hypothetical protein
MRPPSVTVNWVPCGTGSITFREEHLLTVFENGVLREGLGVRGRKWQETGDDCMMRSFMMCALAEL